jgi:L-lactate dehydrogenase complex protein LldF
MNITSDHAALAEKFNKDRARTQWHDETLWWVRAKRDNATTALQHWEEIREAGSSIKEHTLNHLPHYLLRFEKEARAKGVHVHWAFEGGDLNKIVLDITRSKNARLIVKSKSMLTEECKLNEHLEHHQIEVVDTDLGELIIQMRKEVPSHIVLPAIHLKKQEVSDLFNERLKSEPGNTDPQYLTREARKFLREKIRAADIAITGVNFGIAESGSIVICTNEGNADLGVHQTKVHIACMGIEKLIPSMNDLPVFLKLLARSATGQAITSYTSIYSGPAEGKEMHIILVDNGRSTHLADPVFRSSLKCIRCGACMNTCPVYRRSGGHSYRYHVAGPIGSILAPHVDKNKYSDLPFASTLCGSCSNVCPVKINIHEQLWHWRQRLTESGNVSTGKKLGIHFLNRVLSSTTLFRLGGAMLRWTLRHARFLVNSPKLNPWVKNREMPAAPGESFRDWYKKNVSQQ